MIKKVLFLSLVFCLGFIKLSHGQLYVSKACLLAPGDTSTACIEPVRFFEATSNLGGSWEWNFGDDTTTFKYIGRNPSHTYMDPGTYTVTAKAIQATGGTTGTVVASYSKDVPVGYYPTQPTFDGKTIADTTICNGSKITLDPFDNGSAPSNVDYLWFPNGETSRTIDVDTGGCYSVEVKDKLTGCSRSAKINVKVCYVEPPNSGGASETWYFGDGSGLEFTMAGDTTLPDSLDSEGSLNPEPEIENPVFNGNNPGLNSMDADEAAAVVLNASGAIVYYSDGKKLYYGEDDTEVEMADGSPYNIPGNVGTQGVAIVPKPVCNACDFVNYYIFSIDPATNLLSYSVIDTRYNDKKGAVTETNIPVAKDVYGKLTVERNADDVSYNIYAFNSWFGDFESILLDSVGLYPSKTGTAYTNPPASSTTHTSSGNVTISQDGTKLAHGLIISGQNYVQLYDRDPATGQLSNEQLIDLGIAALPNIYGVAFSPSGGLLYVSLNGESTTDSKLIQLDLASKGKNIISESPEEYGALALGPKYGVGSKLVYLSLNNQNFVPYMQSPDEIGDAAEVGFTFTPASAQKGINVAGTTKLGFPVVAAPKQSQDGQGINASYLGNCLNAPTILSAGNVCDPMKNEYEWIVEGKSYPGNAVPVYFSRPGWHDIKLIIKVFRETALSGAIGGATSGASGNLGADHCTTIEHEGRIYIKPAPEISLSNPLYVCNEHPVASSQTVTAYPNITGGDWFEYEWLTIGDPLTGASPAPIDFATYRNQNFTFKAATPYILRVKSYINPDSVNFCVNEFRGDVLKGCEPIIYVPNVFTPNGDGHNETLKVITYYLDRPKLTIFNRWGQTVFETEDLDVKWDGRYKGKVHANQIYPYRITYYPRDFPERGEQQYRGSILVLGE